MSPRPVSARITYAQSSDIKSRSYLEYRKDMKKKAIAELEFLPYLQSLLTDLHGEAVTVEKHGGDRELWFGKPSQDPDYLAILASGKSLLYEFQYAEETDALKHFDFKVSKVGKRIKGRRIPHEDREFFYVVKPSCQFAFLSPRWVMENGPEAPVPAWGSRPACRVPRDVFLQQCKAGGARLTEVIRIVQCKNVLLDFQHDFLDKENEKFSRQLHAVIDDGRILKIMPNTLDGFYRVCSLLSGMNKSPDSPGIWLVYLASLFSADMSAEEFAQFMSALDFLYFKCDALHDNEIRIIKQTLRQATAYIHGCAYNDDGWISRDSAASAQEQTRQILFALNLLEDMQQHVAVTFQHGDKAKKIFSAVADPIKTACAIKTAQLLA